MTFPADVDRATARTKPAERGGEARDLDERDDNRASLAMKFVVVAIVDVARFVAMFAFHA